MSALLYPLVAVFLFVLPGYALLGFLPRPTDEWHLPERVGIAIALSMALYPLLYLWAWWMGLEAGLWVVWGPGALGAAALIGQMVLGLRRARRANTQPAPDFDLWPAVALIALVAVIGFTRWWAVREMVAPAWGDSVHHALIVQLMLEHGGLFQSWLPYAPLETFTYHAGLHANITVWAAATGLPADRALLWGGQLFNVFAVVVLYPLAWRLSGRNAWVGVLAVGVAGLVSTMPGFYTNWGRYTQLGAQILLPALVWCFDRLWGQRPAGAPSPVAREGAERRALALVTALLAAGLVLTHYRVAMVGGAAGVAWALWGLWRARRSLPPEPSEWTRATLWAGLAALGAGILAGPWVLRLGQGHLTTVAGSISAPADSQTAADELVMWGVALDYYPLWLVILGGVSLLVAVWRAPRLGVPLVLWAGLTFLVSNPALVGLRGSGLVSNFLLVIGVYVVFAVPIGWFVWWVFDQLMRRTSPLGGLRRNLAGAALAVGLGLGAYWGAHQQATIINPVHALVAPEDLAVMAWIAAEVPADAQFLANSFLAFSDMAVVGSDAGWWLPFYTQRAVNVLPITYTMETVAPQVDKEAMRQLVLGIRASGGDSAQLRGLLCAAGITHVYQGQRQGTYAPPNETLFPEAWLLDNRDFTLLHRQGFAVVWAFDRTRCGVG
ncbi:MAG: DUF6541 family protein [Litorilinea sp.]